MSSKPMGNFGGSRRGGVDTPLRVALFSALAFICFSSFALFAVFTLSNNQDSGNEGKVEVVTEAKLDNVDVLVPMQPITGGTALDLSMFKVESRPRAGLSDKIIRDAEEIHGMYATTLILPGQPLHKDYLTSVRPVNQITAKIPPGFRAVTIHVDVKTGIEGWAKAGARVDVAWTTTLRAKRAVQIIVENALVISAARQADPNAQQAEAIPNELTLMVNNDDAKKILLASGSGTLSLSLRGDRDPGKSEAGIAITEEDLLSTGKPEEQKKRPESVVKIRDAQGNFAEFILHDGQLVPYTAGM